MRGTIAAVIVVGLLLTSGAPARAQSGDNGGGRSTRGRGAYDRGESGDQRHWERIQLKYVDVRTIAAILGAPVLPTEADLWWARYGDAYGGFGGYGGAMGGYGGMGGYAASGGGFAGGSLSGFGGQ